MKTMFQKFYAVLMVAVLLLCAIPFTASAYSGKCGDNITYTFDENTGVLTISGTGPMWDYLSTGSDFAPWNGYMPSVKKIIIKYGVTTIGDYAFDTHYIEYGGFQNLQSVSIPDSVIFIGEGAFEECRTLTSITLPGSLESIGRRAFINCTGLEYIIIPDSVTEIGEYAFQESGIKSITIGNGLTNISEGAFFGCDRLASVDIGGSVRSIDYAAFVECPNLASVNIGKSVNSIDIYAFYGCTSLANFSVNAGNNYFSSDSNGVLFNKDKTMLISYPVGKTASSYTIPNSVKTIDDMAFMQEKNLKSVTIPDSVIKIGMGAFYECTNLKDVYYNGTQTQWNKISIDNTENCNAPLLNASLHFNGTTVPNVPQTNPTQPTTSAPQTKPATSAPQTQPVVEQITESDSDNIIKGELRTSKGVLYWEINLDDGTFKIWGEGKMPEWNSADEVPWHDYADIVVSVEIGDGVKDIGDYAFADFIKIIVVVISQGTTSIGENAFDGCTNLESVTVPESIEKIDKGAFKDCDSLKEINYEGSQEEWERIEIAAEDNSALEKAKIKLNFNYEDTNKDNKTMLIVIAIAIVVAAAVAVAVILIVKKVNKKKLRNLQ